MSTIIKWDRTGENEYTVMRPQKNTGYTATIEYAGGVYTLTIDGEDAPAPSEHATLRNAKNEFRKYLFDKS